MCENIIIKRKRSQISVSTDVQLFYNVTSTVEVDLSAIREKCAFIGETLHKYGE